MREQDIKDLIAQGAPGIARLLSWFVTDAPLYRLITFDFGWGNRELAVRIVPKTVSMPCSVCPVEITNWDIDEGIHTNIGTQSAKYRCRNCGRNSVEIFYFAGYVNGQIVLEKVGRFPKPEINPPKQLAKALGDNLDLYRNGMTLRQHNYGLGALVYFRRLVEETTDELLDLLDAAVREAGGDAKALKIIADARTATAFEDKVKVAAGALPAHLRIGGANPLHLLYDLLSEGIHGKTDEECVAIVDDMDQVLRYLFIELKAHTEERKTYAEGLKGLFARRAKKVE